MTNVPVRYVPKNLTKKSRKKQIKELKRSRKSYKKGKYYTRKKIKGFKSKRTGWAKKVEDIYGLPKNKAISIAAIQRKTRCKRSALNKIIKKGMGAYYSSGSRPNQTAHSWGKARLYSAISGGPAARVDMKILKEGCPKNSKTLKLARKAKPIRKTRKTKIGGDGETKKIVPFKDELLKLTNQSLINAISKLDISEVKKLLDEGADVNYISKYDESPLSSFLMGYYDDVEDGEILEDKFNIAKLLIDYGADVNHKNSYDGNQGPLTYAVLGNDTNLVDLLIKNGAEVNAISSHGETPLIAAIKDGNNNNDVIRLLLERGSRKNIKDKKTGRTAYETAQHALQHGAPDEFIVGQRGLRALRELLGLGSRPQSPDEFRGDMYEILDIFRDNEAQTAMERRKVDEATLKILPEVLRNNEVKSYLGGGANDEEADLENELYEAVGNDDKEGVKRLIKSGADVNKPAPAFDNNYPVYRAVELKDINMVNLLIKNGADVNINVFDEPLKRAWELEDIDMIKLLIKNGAYVNIELDDKEWAPGPRLLHDAVERARPDLVEILLEAKDIYAARASEIVFFPPDGFTWDATPEKLLELYISNTGDEGERKKNLEEMRDVFKKYDKQIDDEHRELEDIMPKKLNRAAPEMTEEVEKFLRKNKLTRTKGGRVLKSKTRRKTHVGKNKMKEKIVKFKKSERKGKKYMVIVKNKKTGKKKTLHFGATGYEQFKDSTPLKLYSKGNHGDPKRRKNYFNRHSGTPYKNKAVHKESQTGLYTPKLLSHIYLW